LYIQFDFFFHAFPQLCPDLLTNWRRLAYVIGWFDMFYLDDSNVWRYKVTVFLHWRWTFAGSYCQICN